MCKLFSNTKLKACETDKAEALESLAILIDTHSQLETAYSQLQTSYSQCQTELATAAGKLRPDFDVSEAPVVDGAWVWSVLEANLPNFAGVRWWQMDSDYRAATDEEIVKFILWDDTNFWKYHPELKDCDDFGFYFAARFRWFLGRNNCFFTVDWSGGHAYAVFLLRDGKMWIYEPQNDKWWVAGDRGFRQPYPLEHIGLVG